MKKKKISTNQQFKNALRWLNNLQHTKRLKGVGQLMIHKDKFSKLTHKENRDEYCCLGVGCKLFNIKNNINWEFDVFNSEFAELIGLGGVMGIIYNINDSEFKNDQNFKRVRKKIIEKADDIFIPEVAKKIKKTF